MKTLSLIEDDSNIRESLESYISKKSLVEILSVSSSVQEFLELRLQNDPEILLLDIGLPGMSGVEGIPLILAKYPKLNIIMLTTYEEDEIIFSALGAGATSYISKRTPLSKIVEAIDIVEKGGSYMSPSITKKVTRHFIKKEQPSSSKLSIRQLEIVKYMVNGLTYSEIAEKCFISINTVRFHVKKIYSILNIKSKAVLIKRYLDNEL